jgi:AcrR family transcriptional regulator
MGTGRRPLRADAARNQAGILQAARDLIRARGADVGMEEIAREAGVAVGTLYRHFPTKTDLVTAIAARIVQQVVARFETAVADIGRGAPARDELVSLLAWLAQIAGQDRTLKVAIKRLGVEEDLRESYRRVMAALERIVETAHRQNSLYPDVTADDLVLVLTVLPGDEMAEQDRHRWLRLATRGLIIEGDRTRTELGG